MKEEEARRITFLLSKAPLSANKSSVNEELGLIVLLISVVFVLVVVLRWKAIIGHRTVVLFVFYVFFIVTIGVTEDRWKTLFS